MPAEPMRRARILLTHPAEARENWYGARALAELKKLGEVVLNPHDRPFDLPELLAAAEDCPVIVSDRQALGDASVFSGLPHLVAYVRGQVDISSIDVEAASATGVLVTQASRGFMAAVSEWAIWAMIAGSRRMQSYVETYRAGAEPASVIGPQLSGSTLGIIGFGAIAQYLAQSAHALGMRVLIADPYKNVPPPFEQVDLMTLAREADFVAPLAVANAETENIVGDGLLAAMKPTAWLINASRGNLVDEGALERALDERRIAGAALDVGRAPDQKPSPRLAQRPDVIATPHIGGLTPPSLEHQALETVRQTEAILRGEIPVGAVNAAHATRLSRLARSRN
jgi:D-3-phosphoglycerate dehydrogenase / 2-oxoglutarate reductase